WAGSAFPGSRSASGLRCRCPSSTTSWRASGSPRLPPRLASPRRDPDRLRWPRRSRRRGFRPRSPPCSKAATREELLCAAAGSIRRQSASEVATMETLAELAAGIAARLKERRETIAISESSTGGLISAALLAVPGASAYFLGGAVVYTRQARAALLGITDEAMSGIRSASEPYAALCATTVRERHRSTWGLAETGATGPTGNRYGD